MYCLYREFISLMHHEYSEKKFQRKYIATVTDVQLYYKDDSSINKYELYIIILKVKKQIFCGSA